MRRIGCMMLVVSAALVSLPSTAAAQGDGASWSCRASVARVNLPPLPVFEPLIANPDSAPCVDDAAGAPNISLPPAPAVPVVSANAVQAGTETLCAGDDPDPLVDPADNDDCDAGSTFLDQQVRSGARLAGVGVLLPGLVVTAQALESSAAATCNDDGVPVFSGTSRFVGLTINGTPIVLPPDDEPLTQEIGPITIAINERVGTDGVQGDGAIEEELIRRALRITLGDIEVVLGESKVDVDGDVCPPGTISVRKQTAPDEAANGTSFPFTATPGIDPAAFTLTDDGERVIGDLEPGTHTITEGADATGYELADVNCLDASGGTTTSTAGRSATVELARGESVVCTFVNGRIVSSQCPPGSVEELDGTCTKDAQCPAGSVEFPSGNCVVTRVFCPTGTVLVPQLFACLPDPGDGRFVPIGDVRGHATSPCIVSARFGPAIAIIGTNGNDRITGTNQGDRVFAFAGHDRVSGGRGNDCLEGDSGNDTLDASNGNDLLLGAGGRDLLVGGAGRDRIVGGRGINRLEGGQGSDRLTGGPQRDRLRGGDGNDILRGGSGNDGIHTGNGRDRVFGGPGNDTINAATVGAPVRVNCGPGRRDRVRINRGELGRVRNCEFVYLTTRIRTPRD